MRFTLLLDRNELKEGSAVAVKYRKKPVVVEAIIWNGRAVSEAVKFCGRENLDITGKYPGKLKIKTLEGIVTADIGDYIIKGVVGECYPCKPDIFTQTYEEVEA